MVRLRKFGWAFALLGASVILNACAHPEAPKGGPEDKEGPEIKAYFPAQNQTQVSRIPQIYFQFNEWVQESNPSSMVMISPPLAKPPKVEVRRNWIFVQTQDSLDSNTTYTVSLNRNVQDYRGNALATPFSLTLSTGPQLDSLRCAGRLLANDTSVLKLSGNYLVGLYPIENRNSYSFLKSIADSLRADVRPSIEKPMYQVSPNPSGFFEFQGIKPGHYRLFAFADANQDSKFQKGENYAFAEQDIKLPGDSFALILALSANLKADSLRAEALNPFRTLYLTDTVTRLQIVWNQQVNLDSLAIQLASLSDTTKAITLLRQYQTQDQKTTWFDFDPHAIQEDSTYLLKGLTTNLKIRWSSSYDSLQGRVAWSKPEMAEENVGLHDTILFAFDSPLLIPADSVLRVKFEDQIIPFKSVRQENVLKIIPTKPLVEASTYRIWHIKARDSIQLLKFETMDLKKMASLRGQIDQRGIWQIQLIADSSQRVYRSSTQINGSFQFSEIPPGSYQFQYYQDQNQNGKYDVGQEFPYRPAEPLIRFAAPLILQSGTQNLRDLIK